MKLGATVRFIVRFVLFAALLAQAAHAYDGRVASPASVESVKQLFHLSGLDRMLVASVRRGLDAGNRADPDEWVDIDVYMSFVTPETVADRFAPIYANYLSHDYAVKLIAAYGTAAGKQDAKLAILQAESGPAAATAAFRKLPPDMKKAVSDFRRSVVYTSLLNAYEKSHEETKSAFHDWSAEVMKARMTQVNRELAAIIEEDMKEDAASDDKTPQPAEEPPLPEKLSMRTGINCFDEEALSLFISYKQNVELNRQMRRSMQGLKIDDILKPEYLSSRDGIEAANLRVLSLDEVLDNYDKISEKILDNYNRNISRITMSAAERKRLEEGNAKIFAVLIDEQIRENELRRTLIELLKRTISFCEAHLSNIKLEDGTLVFYKSADLDVYRDLVAQINKQAQEINKLVNEEQNRRKLAIEKMKAA